MQANVHVDVYIWRSSYNNISHRKIRETTMMGPSRGWFAPFIYTSKMPN